MATVTGTIAAPAPDYSHTTLNDRVLSTPLEQDLVQAVSVTGAQNTGNVPQTVDVAVSDPIGCTIEKVSGSIGAAGTTFPATLQPGDQLSVSVQVKTVAIPVGGENQPFGFTTTEIWL